jgi:vitamin B12 transporter
LAHRLTSLSLALGLPLFSVLICSSESHLARAEAPAPERIDPVVVTATRSPTPLSSLLSDVRVIDREAISEAGSETLTELLQARGGIEIVANGGPGQPSGVFLRGTNSNHVLLLIDGMRVNSATSGTNAFEHIPLQQIERIEILSGPASSLYGADALGGVIQIFTRKGEGESEFAVNAGVGTYRTRRLGAGLSGHTEGTRFSVQAGYDESRGFSATNERVSFGFDPDGDASRNRNASINVTHSLLAGHDVSLGAWVSRGDTQFDNGPGGNDVNHSTLSSFYLETRNRIGEAWLSTLRVGRSRDEAVFTGSAAARFRTDQQQADWHNEVKALLGTLVLGGAYRTEQVSSDTLFVQTKRNTVSAYTGYTGEFGPHLFQGSARYDRYDGNNQIRNRGAGSLAYGYRLSSALRLAANVGTAFKLPSFNDLYSPPFQGFSGNPNLEPERALNRELALYYDTSRQRAGLTLFANDIHKLIALDSTFTTVTNVNEARIRGATLTYALTGSDYRLTAEVTTSKPEDRATHRLLARRARNYGSLSAAKSFRGWQLGAEWVASGARFDSATNDPATRLGGYSLVNVFARYRPRPEWALTLRCNNLLDKRYELAQGYNTPRVNLFVGMEYTMPVAGQAGRR